MNDARFNGLSMTTKTTYMFLSRLLQDIEYFLGYGNGCERHLWSGSVNAHIVDIWYLWYSLDVKPQWLTKGQLRAYEIKLRNYEVS